jgi:hypothetical protein
MALEGRRHMNLVDRISLNTSYRLIKALGL